MSGMFVGLRQSTEHACLDPDPAVGYLAGNLIAAQAKAADFNGIIYPSVRHSGGTCIAALRPNLVQSVVQGGMNRLTWSGRPQFNAEQIEHGAGGRRPACGMVSSGQSMCLLPLVLLVCGRHVVEW